MADKPLNQHDIEIQANRLAWERKPLLQAIYRDFYRKIARALQTEDGEGVLELGSGMGSIKTVLPKCLTSDIFPNPWLDRTESAYQINIDDASLNGIVLFDVWHHLEFPGSALKEFARVLRPGGRVVLFEPAMGALGRVVYGAFHHEPLGLGQPLPTSTALLESPPLRYYAAQGNAWRMFAKNDREWLTGSPFVLRHVALFSALGYVASGGFSKPQLYPALLSPVVEKTSALLDHFPRLFATRMLVCLQRSAV